MIKINEYHHRVRCCVIEIKGLLVSKLRIFHDFCAETPLWLDGNGPVLYSDLGLSDTLSRDLDAWTRFWNENYTPDGWRTADAYREYRQVGKDLIRRLCRELPDWNLTVDPELRELCDT